MELFVARQPIFDRQDRLFGYELLYRGSREASVAGGAPPHQMTCEVIANAFLELGIDRVAHGRPAFINVTRQMLLDGHLSLLPADSIGFEIPARLAHDPEIAVACRELAEGGYRLVLDGFTESARVGSLLELCELTKIDVLGRDPGELARTIEVLSPSAARAVAVRVQSRELRRRSLEVGFDLFQGNFFRSPDLLVARRMSVELAEVVRLHNLLLDETEEEDLVRVLRSAPGLAYRLLRMASTSWPGGTSIGSIEGALRLVGRDLLRRWLSILLVSSAAGTGGVGEQLAAEALFRARFLELLAGEDGASAGSFYLTGLVSGLDALLGMPMSDVLSLIDLPEEVREALGARAGRLGEMLDLVEAYEGADWARVTNAATPLGIGQEGLSDRYREALVWSRERLLAGGG